MMKPFLNNSYLFGSNAPFIEELYETYLENPAAVSDQWRDYFDQLQNMPGNGRDVAHAPVIASFAQMAKQGKTAGTSTGVADKRQVGVLQMINAYRFLGNRWAQIDPLKRQERPSITELEPSHYGFTEADLSAPFNIGSFQFQQNSQATLREILEALRQTYCGTLAAEYMYISDIAQKRWIQSRLEPMRSTPAFPAEQKKRILERLTAAETLEKYLHTKYVGQKRFSLEGGESAIVAMDSVINTAGANGVQEIVIGMAHRGRLNVLVNTLGKSPSTLFGEFEGKYAEELAAGDVKYHKGFSSDVNTAGGPVHLTLAFNPSHLEIVNPVVLGSVFARQKRRDGNQSQVLPVLIHGDAAVAGQGINQEILNFSQTRGYGVGGAIHIVINNQIGFTTSDPRDSRSSMYCTDIFKMADTPIFHVNGDDPEAVALACQLAVEFRQTFKKDVVIDLLCYRKLGHNEADEPMVTQPLMYKKIAQHPGTRKLYADRLIGTGVCGANEPDGIIAQYREHLDRGELLYNPVLSGHSRKYAQDWSPYLHKPYTDEGDTGVPLAELKRLAQRLTTMPEGFTLHPTVAKVVEGRKAMGEGARALDWGMGENLAYASLVAQGYGVRLSGQDCGRGTFSHRHAVFHDQNREKWDAGSAIPLQSIQDGQASFVVIDSVLSEAGVLGFEYGYATAEPNQLIIWEAQFGDFANGAQVVIDQFIASGEAKWGRQAGITMLLPHGYEGQGPEHSSARIERFMQLCAEDNWQVCVPSTPAQIFHVLRRQMVRPLRKPLVVITPKSLLRHKDATSSLEELASGTYRTIIDEVDNIDAKKAKRIVLCSGKVYYELLAERRAKDIKDVVIVRVEQLYPFPEEAFDAVVHKYPNAKEVVWCQEEPRNQGSWYWFASRQHLAKCLRKDQELFLIARPASASPAVGYSAKHNVQQKAVIEGAFGPLDQGVPAK
ncbi:2-oxoglutarate dehydrogenase E1 component [Uliginosibacterium sp. H3]|uniref:oxoglutarate dehydrogenase (succinyl-transferring) n=1 Tax=Uliginosibacterium silvisoli TaxID=3114758 RepID=A0ABU6K9B1_9RHOO|nr:2-oxoglutarate dehydrogenase E1 component [Uliginosibacterium sp. H3]